jgi:hypothetical protein
VGFMDDGYMHNNASIVEKIILEKILPEIHIFTAPCDSHGLQLVIKVFVTGGCKVYSVNARI